MSTPSEELSKTQEEIASLQAREAEVNYHDLCTHRGHSFLGRMYSFIISLSYNQSFIYLPS